jgi:Putative DNA-binding domain
MASWHSLLACAQADVTIERIASLTAITGTEPLTVDFKEKADSRLAACVASMANSHGGLVLVGITDRDRRIVGVKAETLAHVADMLATHLDPGNWLPEMFEVPIGDEQPGRYVLAIRIRPELAPRPVMVQRKGPGGDNFFWIPVRIPGGTRQATRAEMAALFAEQPAGHAGLGGSWNIDAPQIPSGADGTPDPTIDMILKTGLIVTPGPACPGRPLSEAVIANLASALDKSPLANALLDLTGMPGLMGRNRLAGRYSTQRRGRPNTSGTATLVWQITSRDVQPFDMTFRVDAPDQYGHAHIQTLNVSIEVINRLTAWQSEPNAVLPIPPGTHRRLEKDEWIDLLDAFAATLIDPAITAAIADLADVDPILVPPPRNLHIVSGQEMAGFLPPLQSIAGVTGSRGAHLRADPTLTLADPDDRTEQVTRWLCQIAADAGLMGMERLVRR